jgi:hypothetical protein
MDGKCCLSCRLESLARQVASFYGQPQDRSQRGMKGSIRMYVFRKLVLPDVCIAEPNNRNESGCYPFCFLPIHGSL